VSDEADAELARVLDHSLLAANQALQDGKPAAALDMADIVLAALPAEGLEAVELAALPIKIVALSYLGRIGDALQALGQMERRAASPDDREACRLLRERLTVDLTPRANAAAALINAGRPEGLVEMEAVANHALQIDQHMIAIGALMVLGKVHAAGGDPEVARDHLLRARQHLEAHRPFDPPRHDTALRQIDELLATLPA
jgi:ATP/maltotriose-dependent transcriptional regulator MalT